jgi:hypothetical protein
MEKNQPSPQADAGINYIQWREPNEGAYTVEVPSRWTTTGGIERYPKGHIVSLEGGRSILKAISPDGNVVITIGDINVPNFNTPTQVSQMSGFGEGSFMGEYMIMPYVIGTQFAEFYITNMLAQEFDYTNLNIIHRQDLPEMSKAINDN